MSQLRIIRGGNATTEFYLTVQFHPIGRKGWSQRVCPRDVVTALTGRKPSQYYSFMAFIRGITDACGMRVVLEDRRWAKRVSGMYFPGRGEALRNPACYMAGIIWWRSEGRNLEVLASQMGLRTCLDSLGALAAIGRTTLMLPEFFRGF